MAVRVHRDLGRAAVNLQSVAYLHITFVTGVNCGTGWPASLVVVRWILPKHSQGQKPQPVAQQSVELLLSAEVER